jgi:hypothetical protein
MLAIEADKMAHLGFFYRSDFALVGAGVPAFTMAPRGKRSKGSRLASPGRPWRSSSRRWIIPDHTPADEYRDGWGFFVIMEFALHPVRTVAGSKSLFAATPGFLSLAARDRWPKTLTAGLFVAQWQRAHQSAIAARPASSPLP